MGEEETFSVTANLTQAELTVLGASMQAQYKQADLMIAQSPDLESGLSLSKSMAKKVYDACLKQMTKDSRNQAEEISSALDISNQENPDVSERLNDSIIETAGKVIEIQDAMRDAADQAKDMLE